MTTLTLHDVLADVTDPAERDRLAAIAAETVAVERASAELAERVAELRRSKDRYVTHDVAGVRRTDYGVADAQHSMRRLWKLTCERRQAARRR